MSGEGRATQVSDGITRVGFAPDELLLAADVTQFLETTGMAGQVTVGEFADKAACKHVCREGFQGVDGKAE